MKNSVFLRRIVLLLLAAVLLTGLLTTAIYILVTQRSYAKARADELLPIARTIAGMMAEQDTAYGTGMQPLFEQGNKNFLGAELQIYDADGNPYASGEFDKLQGGKLSDQARFFETSDDMQTVLSGEDVSTIRKLTDGDAFLVVSVPVVKDNSTVGAVAFTKPMSELNDAAGMLYQTLLISSLFSFAVMLIPGFLAARRLVLPIRQMRDVAQHMAKGDFSKRADENQKGEIGELGRSMNHFASESERLEQTRRDFVANVSHELRTPIAAIRAMGETLRDGMAKTDEKKALFYNNIVRESIRLSRLVDDLLELSRLQSGAEAMKKVDFDLRDVFQNISDSFGVTANDAGIILRIETPEMPVNVYSNPDRVEQLLVIIMDNAVKHTPQGGSITLAVRREANKATVSVSNTGDTIDSKDFINIFERFYKADKSHSGGGTGLGLSIAREIVNGLNEHIRASSTDGITTFEFTVSMDR